MKHAFLIIAHNEYPILEVLLSMLDDERNDIYLHIDKRAVGLYQKIKGFKIKKAGFYLIEKNMKVYWGDISLVKGGISPVRDCSEKRTLCLLSLTVRSRPSYQEPRLHS